MLVPQELGNFSGNKVQLDNDRFMAYCYMLLDNPQLRPIFENALCTRLVRLLEVCQKTSRLPYLKPVFFKYLISKVNPQLPDIQYLKKCSRFF